MTQDQKTIEEEFKDIEVQNDFDSQPEVEQDLEEQELSVSDFDQINYIKTPEVGESIEFTIDKIVNNPKTKATNKTTGEEFNVGVEKKDGTVIRRDIVTTNGERFTLNSWGLFYLFFDRKAAFAQKVRDRGSINGIKVKLTRNYDGSVPNKKVKDVMKLYDLESEEAAAEYQKEVAKALKEGRLFTLDILE